MLLQDGHKGGCKWRNRMIQILNLKYSNVQNPCWESLYNSGPGSATSSGFDTKKELGSNLSSSIA